MRYGRITVYLFTLLFAVMAVVIWVFEARVETLPISLILTSAEQERTITCWKNKEGEYYLFLPGYAKRASARLQIHARNVRIDSRLAVDGMSCEKFMLDTPYSLSFDSKKGKVNTTLTFAQSENLPALYIDTGSGSMEYIHSKKGNQETGRMSLYTPDGEIAYIGNLDEIKSRGNGTWKAKKKPYSLKLVNEADLLGMGYAQKWILLANAFDATNLRNKIIYDFAREANLAYTPDCELVDLYLNGEYAGLYMLCERNEVLHNRVDISREGSFLVSKEWDYRLEEQQLPFVQTDSGAALRIHYSTMDMNAMTQIWQSVENALAAPNGTDPNSGKHWTELIDLDSWARKYLVEEIFGNPDASIISQFFYLDGAERSGKIYAGPIWDQDLAMGNTMMWPVYVPNMFFANRDNINASPWFHDLYQKEEFYQRVQELWMEEMRPQLESLVQEGIADYADGIATASRMNALRWNLVDFREENQYIRNYMAQRLDFLDYLWCQEPDYCLVQANSGRGLFACYVMEPGSMLPELPSYDDDSFVFYGWYRRDTEEPFDVTQPIYDDIWIYLKQESVAVDQ